jgi:transposase
MFEGGKGVTEVARLLGCAQSSVSRWKLALERGGKEALNAKPHPGGKPRLTEHDKKRLVRILLQGPRAAGFATDLWTCSRVAQVILRTFGVSYHPDHVWRILHKLGWSCQKPEHRARERDEQAIAYWRGVKWPDIKKGSTV